MIDVNQIWKLYEDGQSYHHKFNLYDRLSECWRFYNGDQWDGLKVSGDKPPALNFIAPIVDYKVATVAQNGVVINYSPVNMDDNYKNLYRVCEKLNAHAAKTWEKLKFDAASWGFLTEMAVGGTVFVYFYDDAGINYEMIDATSVYLGDEQQADIQKQPYIIIAERRLVDDVKKQAKECGVDESDIELIMSDEDTDNQIGERAKTEIKSDAGKKCTTLLYVYKDNGTVTFCRCVKDVKYQPDTPIDGMSLYPVAMCAWSREKGSARGNGEVYSRIPNQIEANKALARYLAAIKQTAYPHVVYNKTAIKNDDVQKLINTVGAAIGVDDQRINNVGEIIQYMQPTQVNPQAINIVEQLESKTRDLANAGDAATGSINPEQASGAAIVAVQDAQAVPLQRVSSAYKQFFEDIARIWFDMWRAYNPNGLNVTLDEDFLPEAPPEIQAEFMDETGQIDDSVPVAFSETIPPEELNALQVDIKIDISPASYYSKYAQESTLSQLLQAGYISFEEYVGALDDNSAAPKHKLEDIISQRQQAQQAQQEAQLLQMPQEEIAEPAGDVAIEDVPADVAQKEIINIANNLGGTNE